MNTDRDLERRRERRSPRQKAILSAMERRLVLESDKVHGRLSYLRLIAKVSLLLGILGTTMGMFEAFGMTARSSPRSYFSLPGAIERALVSTWLGLAVAIPARILFFVLSQRATRMIREVERTAKLLMRPFTDEYFD